MENASSSGLKKIPRIVLKSILFLAIFFSPYSSEAAAFDLETDLQQNLEESRSVVGGIVKKMKAGSATNVDAARLKKITENIRALHLLLQERFKLREKKIGGLGAKAAERHRVMAEGYKKALTAYLALVDGIPASGKISKKTIASLTTLLDTVLQRKKRPLIGSLPYINLNYGSREPNTSLAVTPAYKGGNATAADADLTGTAEAPITEEIAALARSLDWNPVLMYEFVKNNVDTEWYWGCMKGAEETLRQFSGNDCDQASLLVALLRASGYPARYVRGTIEFFPDLRTATVLTGIEDPGQIAAFFQKAGIPYKIILDGTSITNIQIEHLWVETLVPYSNYRGAIIDERGKAWLGLDTSVKANGYAYNTAPDIVSEYALKTSRDDYLGRLRADTPLEYLRARINEYLVQSHPTTTYSDYVRTKTLVPEVMQILPGSMQFSQVKVANEYTQIPDELKYKATFTASDGAAQLFSVTLDALDLSNKKIIISYEPETIEDQEVIDSFGGLDSTPCYLVRLRPVLLVKGQRIAVGEGGTPMGAEYNLSVTIASPGGAETFTNTMISGSLTAIGFVSQRAVVPSLVDEKNVSDLLYREVIRYVDDWNKGEEELASLVGVSLARPLPAVVKLGNTIEVTYLLDQPHGFTWKGLYVDADLRVVEAVAGPPAPDDRTLTFMRLSALQGSALEHKLFEDAFGVSSVSTAKVIGIANGTEPLTPILTIDQGNIADVLPTLPVDQNIKDDITDSVNNQNLTVRIPQSEVAYLDWTGAGYIKENPLTGEAGYMLSGMVAGGMTAVSPLAWQNNAFEAVLSQPYKDSNKKIMILTPQNESTITYSPVDVTGILLDAGSTVTVNGVAAEVIGNTFTAYGIKLNPWENLISADSVGPAGSTAHDSVAINYKIPLAASITFPYDGSNLSNTPVFIEGAVTDPTASVVVNNVKASVLADGRFTATGVPLYEGANPVTLTAVNRLGEKTTNTVTLNYHAVDPGPTLAVSITSPAGNAAINNETVTVSGTITSGAQEMSVMVNGVFAEIYNGQFNANNVPLVDGSNVIIADAVDASGAVARSQISITANTAIPHVTLSTNIQGGVAPLTTYFSISSNVTTTITSYSLNFGDGSALYTGTTFDNVSHTYTLEGVIHPVITASDSQGNIYTATIAVTIQSRDQINALLTNKWNGMKEALLVGNTEAALNEIVSYNRTKYGQVFQALGSAELAAIVAAMSDPNISFVYGSDAEAEITRQETGGEYSYTVSFVKDQYGSWKIRSF